MNTPPFKVIFRMMFWEAASKQIGVPALPWREMRNPVRPGRISQRQPMGGKVDA